MKMEKCILCAICPHMKCGLINPDKTYDVNVMVQDLNTENMVRKIYLNNRPKYA